MRSISLATITVARYKNISYNLNKCLSIGQLIFHFIIIAIFAVMEINCETTAKCQNGGTCRNTNGSPVCVCPAFTTGIKTALM